MCVAENVEAADKNYAVDVHADTLKPWKIKKPRIELCHLWYVSCELITFYDRRDVAVIVSRAT